jgi:hypothetical protein
MTSCRILPRAALALIIGCCANVAQPCSVSRELDAPHDLGNTWGFYGQVIGHVSMRIPGCEKVTYEDVCAPSWGLKIRILQPLNARARTATEVEYYEFITASDCRPRPVPQGKIQSRYPGGTRVAVAASLFTWGPPDPQRIRLTSLRQINGEAMYIVPEGADLPALSAAPFDYAATLQGRRFKLSRGERSRINFEIWRDTLRLHDTRSEAGALPILLRMAAAADVVGVFKEDAQYTTMEQLVDRYLPTPEVRVEFVRQLPAVYAQAGVRY